MEKFFSGAKLQIIFHTLAFLPLFCIKQQQNIFLERKRVLIILRKPLTANKPSVCRLP